MDGKIEVVDDSACTSEKPEAEKACMLRPCDGVDWITTEWSGVSQICTNGLFTFIFYTKTGKFFVLKFYSCIFLTFSGSFLCQNLKLAPD